MNLITIALLSLLVAVPQKAEATATIPLIVVPLTIEQKIEQTFNDSRMVPIIRCESDFKQFATSTIPLISPTEDVGITQINQTHWKQAELLGLNIFGSEDDNLKMAKIIYDTEGIKAWSCSRLVKDV